MKKLLDLFKAPSASALARTQLEIAKRDLLSVLAQQEHAALLATYQRGVITRLTRMIESGELGELA